MHYNEIRGNLCDTVWDLWTKGPAVMIPEAPEAAKVAHLLFIKLLV